MSNFYNPSYPNGLGSTTNLDIPAALARVKNLTNSELRELLNDEEKCDQLIKSLDQIKALYAEKEMLMASNKSLAEYNLSQEPKIQQARSNLQEKHRDAVRLVEKIKIIRAEVDSNSGKTDPETLLALLQAASSEAEDDSEQLAQDFLSKRTSDIENFLETFMEHRKLAHTRRIKIDKMKELLESSMSSKGTTPSRCAPAPPAAAAYYPPMTVPSNNWGLPPQPPPVQSSNNLPYPINPTGMPSTGY